MFITGVVIIVIGGECTSFRFRLRLVGVVTLLKVHKIEIFFGFDFEICIISFLVMSKY